MKKIIFALTFIFGVSAVAQAQYKPEGGEKNIEVNFAPLGGSPVALPFGLKFRSFSANNTALRLGVFVGYDNTSTITQEEDFDDDNEQIAIELSDRMSSFTIALQPGFEKHLTGTDRLSPYWGGYLNIGYTSNTEIMEMQDFIGDGTDPGLQVGDTKTTTGELNLGLNLVSGVDYYFAEHIYIGAEVGFGFAMSNDLKSKETINTTELNDNGNWVDVTEENESIVGQERGFQVGPNVVAQIRAGWLF